MKKKLLQEAEKQLQEQNYARYTFNFSDNVEIVRGCILDFSKKLILFQESDNFMIEPFGYKILPLKNLSYLRFNDVDSFYNQILKSENQTQFLSNPTEIDISDWQSLFESLKNASKCVIVEHDSPDKKNFISFTIGDIKSITKKYVHVLNFKADGVWDKKPTKIKFKNIQTVNFDDNYSKVFRKYV
jgi:hypothetical protein